MRLSRAALPIADTQVRPVRRRVVIVAEGNQATAELEDDFHRMGVRIEHDHRIVTTIAGDSSRHPWHLCARATEKLPELVGKPLTVDFVAALGMANAREHCTHLFDLAALAITAAARETPRRVYDSICSYDGAIAHLQLSRDGRAILDWHVDGSTVRSADAVSGRDIRRGFAEWCRYNLDIDTAEAALVLRRMAMIAQGRGVDLDQFKDATPVVAMLDGACYVLRKGNGPNAPRLRGSTLSFDADPPLTPHDEVHSWFSTPRP